MVHNFPLTLSLLLPFFLSGCWFATMFRSSWHWNVKAYWTLMYLAKIPGVHTSMIKYDVCTRHTSCTKGTIYIRQHVSLSLSLSSVSLCPATGLVRKKFSRDNIDEWKLAKLMHSFPPAISNEVSSISLMSWVLLVSFESESIQIKMNRPKRSHSVQARHFRRLPVCHWEHHGIRQLCQGRADPIVSFQISCHIALTVEEDLTRSYNVLRDVWSLATHLMLDRCQNFTNIKNSSVAIGSYRPINAQYSFR